ncbi:FAD binding domain-containing protein [Liberiplasma polymorphum]|uniref:FAD binding domain-containing protein n=1 Tax=Liberiplasma polymorphum TaxID=3374570 RepID=UPI0037711219
MVEHYIPTSYQEALEILSKGNTQVFAGGTDLMIQYRSTSNTLPKFKKNMLYAFNLEELKYIKKNGNIIHIGAMTPLEELLENDLTPAPLKKIIKEMASPALRHVATLAGNIANASPAGDSLIVLYLLNARIICESIHGLREVPIETFITGVRKTVLLEHEIIKEIIINNDSFTQYEVTKVGTRKADAIAKVSVAIAITIEEEIIKDFRVVIGSVATTVIRERHLEKQFININIETMKNQIDKVLANYDPLIKPIDDQRSNKTYRRHVAHNLIRDFITNI